MAIKYLHRRKSARRVLLWMAIPTLLLQYVANALMDGPRPDLRSPHVARVLADIRAMPAPADVVCLGTSRFGMGLSSTDIEKQLGAVTGGQAARVFNDAIPSGDFDTSDFLMKAMLSEGWQPALVVIEVCPEMVNRRNRLFGAHVMPPLRRETATTYLSDLILSMNVRRLFVERLIPVYRYRRAFLGEAVRLLKKNRRRKPTAVAAATPIPPASSEQVAAGAASKASEARKPAPAAEELFLNGDPSGDPGRLTAENLPRVQVWLENYRVGGTASLALERLVRRCRKNDMKVLLVAPPVASCQRAIYTPTIENVFVSYMRRLEQAYACRFIDYRNGVADELFFDNHHLRPAGKSLFSRQLTRDVLVPIWSRIRQGQPSQATAKTSTCQE
jgi:hypothetical protein